MRTETGTMLSSSTARTRRSSRRLVGLTLLTAAVIGGLLVLEAAARIVFDRNGMHYGIEMWKYASQLKRESSNPEMGHEHVPNGQAHLMGTDVRINSGGLRSPEIAAERLPGMRRLLVLGDSLTFGWGVEEPDTYSRVLERMLDASGRPYEVINAGVGNYNTSQQVAWFAERGVRYQPDEVILAFYINDAEPTPRRSEAWLAGRSYLYVLAASAWDALLRAVGMKKNLVEYYTDLYADDNPGWQACQNSLDRLIDMCRARGIGIRLVLLPELHYVNDTYPFRFIHQRVAARAGVRGVPVLDLDGAFRDHEPKSLWVSPGDAHPNALAQRIIAQQLFLAMTAVRQ
jgi:lysophospholipase L1-like esterase